MSNGSPVAPQAPEDAWRHALRLAAASEQYIAQLRAAMELSSNEMNTLLLLHDGGPCTMTELAHKVRISRPALTSLVERLVIDGWLERLGHPSDRRRVMVSLTDRFERELVRASHAWRQRLQNHASTDIGAWRRLLDDIDVLCQISSRSALELGTSVTRPDP